MKELLRYGTVAKEVLPHLTKLITQYREEMDLPDWHKRQKIASVEAAVTALEAVTTRPEL